jgi:hypothetical protein
MDFDSKILGRKNIIPRKDLSNTMLHVPFK